MRRISGKNLCLFLLLLLSFPALFPGSALAKDTWKQEGDQWYCYDKDGILVRGEWRNSGGDYYYLDEQTGAMVKNRLVDDGTGIYYCDADGIRVTDSWVQVPVENGSDGWEYMYFTPSGGKAVVFSSPDTPDRQINGKSYRFSTEGYMLYGYLNEDDEPVSYASDAEKYYGTKTDGSAFTGWVNVRNGEDEGADGQYRESSSIWFYFSSGKKLKDLTDKALSGGRYSFDENGVMLTGWQLLPGEEEEIQRLRYYGEEDDGILKKNQWIRSSALNEGGDDTVYRYWAGSDGSLAAASESGSVFRVREDGQYYCFDAEGRMLSGLLIGRTGDLSSSMGFRADPALTAELTDADAYSAFEADRSDPQNTEAIMFFSSDYEKDGAMKTGAQEVLLEGETLTVVFDSRGYAIEGVRNRRVYNNGVLQLPEDGTLGLVRLHQTDEENGWGLDYWLADASGNIQKNTRRRNAAGIWWYAGEDGTPYCFSDEDYAAQAAASYARKSGERGIFQVGKVNYTCTETAVYDEESRFMYYQVSWRSDPS